MQQIIRCITIFTNYNYSADRKPVRLLDFLYIVLFLLITRQGRLTFSKLLSSIGLFLAQLFINHFLFNYSSQAQCLWQFFLIIPFDASFRYQPIFSWVVDVQGFLYIRLPVGNWLPWVLMISRHYLISLRGMNDRL